MLSSRNKIAKSHRDIVRSEIVRSEDDSVIASFFSIVYRDSKLKNYRYRTKRNFPL